MVALDQHTNVQRGVSSSEQSCCERRTRSRTRESVHTSGNSKNKRISMMKKDAASPSPASTNSSKVAVKELNANDVLLGRGPGLSQFEGNLKFRALVDERKEEYTATTNRKQKRKIAKEIVDLVHSTGGRFLKQEGGVTYDGVWYEADLDTSMEKTKQALREQRDPIGASVSASKSTHSHTEAISSQNYNISDQSSNSSDGDVPEAKTTMPTSFTSSLSWQNSTSLATDTHAKASSDFTGLGGSMNLMEAPASLPGTLQASTASPNLLSPSPQLLPEHRFSSALDPRLLLFRQTPSLFQQQATLPQPTGAAMLPSTFLPSATLPPELQRDVSHLMSMNIAATVARQRFLADNAMYSMLRDFALLQTQNSAATVQDQRAKRALEEKISESIVIAPEKNGVNTTKVANTAALKGTSEEEKQSCHTEDEVVVAFLLSSLAIVDRPVMTEEEEEIERAALTDQERASILADAFGDMCKVSPHQSKKPRRDLDENSIAFLIRQMVIEIEKIPVDRKQALAEALSKGLVEEFSDKRLEKFLRCEGLNAKVRLESVSFKIVNSVFIDMQTYASCRSLNPCSWQRSALFATGKVAGKCLGRRSFYCQ